MLECEIKFQKNPYLMFIDENNDELYNKDYDKYWILGEDNRINIYQSKSYKDIICYIIPDHVKLQKNESELKLIYSKNKAEQEILSIRGSDHILNKFQKIVTIRQKFLAFKGPLCYNPAQHHRPSLFDTKQNTNLRGFLNLAFLIVFATNFRMMIENFLKYGLRVQISIMNILWQFQVFIISTSAMIFGFIGFAYNIEKLAFNDKIPENMVAILNAINIMLCFIIPCIITQVTEPNPHLALSVLFIDIILVLKMISYSHVMRNTRLIGKKIFESEKLNKDIYNIIGENEISPENIEIIRKHSNENFKNILKLSDLIYFLCAPTLCFQLIYPKTKSIRKVWLAKRCMELIGCLLLFAFIIEQYIIPTLQNSIDVMKSGGYLKMFERILRLSIPSLYAWILSFFAFFQFFFNITSELLRFADREFYQDWWNCHDFNEYWRKWNMPVHNWFIRHVYNPLIKRGYSKMFAMHVVFFISALGHEYLVSASLRVWTYWAFIGFMMQAPIMILQKKLDNFLKHSQLGNVAFWVTFCFIGQPICLIIYYYEYFNLNN